jgi:hypothetical protein
MVLAFWYGRQTKPTPKKHDTDPPNPEESFMVRSLKHLFGSSKTTTARRPAAVKPQLEMLEERALMTVSVGLTNHGHTLNIVATGGHNFIAIDQRDSLNYLIVYQGHVDNQGQVSYDGEGQPFSSSDITKVEVKLQGGANLFQYGADNVVLTAKDVKVDLGRYDHDTANLVMNQATVKANFNFNLVAAGHFDSGLARLGNVADARVGVTVNYGNAGRQGGSNIFNAILEGNLTGKATLAFAGIGGANGTGMSFMAHGNIDPRAQLSVAFFGGAGKDAFYTSFQGRDDGKLNLFADGGGDFDRIQADVIIDQGSTGALDVVFKGGAGDDNLRLDWQLPAGFRVTHATLDGGAGRHDSAFTKIPQSKLKLKDIEQVFTNY